MAALQDLAKRLHALGQEVAEQPRIEPGISQEAPVKTPVQDLARIKRRVRNRQKAR